MGADRIAGPTSFREASPCPRHPCLVLRRPTSTSGRGRCKLLAQPSNCTSHVGTVMQSSFRRTEPGHLRSVSIAMSTWIHDTTRTREAIHAGRSELEAAAQAPLDGSHLASSGFVIRCCDRITVARKRQREQLPDNSFGARNTKQRHHGSGVPRTGHAPQSSCHSRSPRSQRNA